MAFNIEVNDHTVAVDMPGDMPLLWAIRESVGLTGTKFGCGKGLCGACTVHVDGRPVRSCSFALSHVGKSKITTIEGLGTQGEKLRAAWIAEQVPALQFTALRLLGNSTWKALSLNLIGY